MQLHPAQAFLRGWRGRAALGLGAWVAACEDLGRGLPARASRTSRRERWAGRYAVLGSDHFLKELGPRKGLILRPQRLPPLARGSASQTLGRVCGPSAGAGPHCPPPAPREAPSARREQSSGPEDGRGARPAPASGAAGWTAAVM